MLPIFVINLDGSDERLTNVEGQLAKQNLNFERISAVDGRKLDEASLHTHYCPKTNRKAYYKALTPGEIGCYLSHRKAWQHMVDNQIPHAIILEDDFILENSLGDLQRLVNGQPDFDYVKLSDHPSRPRKTQTIDAIGDSQLIRFEKVPARTCAQLVSLRGAEKLLKHSERFGRPIDIDLQFWWEKNIEILGFKPFPFSPAPDVKSDITAVQSRSSVKKHRVRRIKQQLAFKINNALRNKGEFR
ncbi:glycosyltransferase family 25 protein [Ningiella sp. W23]|uniref:glycosyltransferase family 25 protein n=1 Tax=Ningiella sp. W23 TaxID=3023715 RepID=UPI0037564768